MASIDKFEITFLGTGTSQGVPVIGCDDEVCLSDDSNDKRLRSSLFIEWDDLTFVIDCGPDFRQQMLSVNAKRIEGILFTHYHADHTAGLDDTRPFTQRFGSLPIYANRAVMDNLKERFSYIFTTKNKYLGSPKLQINVINNSNFSIKNYIITPVEVVHGNLKIFGYKFNNCAYITDASSIVELEKEKLKNLNILIINALRIDPHPTHFNLEEALNLIKELQPEKAYLTHISHKLGFHKQVSKQLPTNVFLAYDGLKLTL